ncbi:F-actin-capping protein subunit beta-like [Octopus sinensis]|uniref:F-actin-capping protein subunit beta n=1 Tax=Octopus sinensis TaxID=2607531 RepID=A0A6P7U1U4_9MOLL|nr:F-actin-capping protein subunit beta-like [Octopus sinensis]
MLRGVRKQQIEEKRTAIPNRTFDPYLSAKTPPGIWTDKEIDCALDLCRRLPPQNINKIMSDIIKLKPEICESLLALVDRPLPIKQDSSGKDFLICEYNRDGDSYRSPWTNTYTDNFDGVLPSDELRELEIKFNEVFLAYTDMYYGGALSSVYLWNMDSKNIASFGGAVLIKKMGENSSKVNSAWDSIHIFEANVITFYV